MCVVRACDIVGQNSEIFPFFFKNRVGQKLVHMGQENVLQT